MGASSSTNERNPNNHSQIPSTNFATGKNERNPSARPAVQINPSVRYGSRINDEYSTGRPAPTSSASVQRTSSIDNSGVSLKATRGGWIYEQYLDSRPANRVESSSSTNLLNPTEALNTESNKSRSWNDRTKLSDRPTVSLNQTGRSDAINERNEVDRSPVRLKQTSSGDIRREDTTNIASFNDEFVKKALEDCDCSSVLPVFVGK